MKKRIFVVDDERCIADTLAAILCKAGYEASAFYNAKSALQEIGCCKPECSPELVITDVDMPGMNGVEMAVCIREHCQGCKVLLFSGRASSQDLLDAANTRGYDFELLSKPIHPRDLLARLEDVEPEVQAS
jgi:DNA-binding response OmpR family regulator